MKVKIVSIFLTGKRVCQPYHEGEGRQKCQFQISEFCLQMSFDTLKKKSGFSVATLISIDFCCA